MCVNRKEITISSGRKMFVDCGFCESCLQQKAYKRAVRIRNNSCSDGSTYNIFVTLTYRNSALPYILKSDLHTFPVHKEIINYNEDGPDSYELVKYIPLYRNLRASKLYKNKFRYGRVELSILRVPLCEFDDLKPIVKSKEFKYSVIYYKDIQDFFKRLRQNLSRHFNYELPFSYFSCSEYGKTTNRAHFHLVLSVPSSSSFNMWQSAISESWPFDSDYITSRSIEIAVNVSSYVSSYVNKLSTLPSFLRFTKQIKPKTSHSLSFGLNKSFLSLDKILEMFRNGTLRYDEMCYRGKSLLANSRLLPKYALYYYWPKFKGYSRLTSDEIIALLSRPHRVYEFKQKMQLTSDDCVNFIKSINNRLTRYNHNFDYIFAYAHIYNLYQSEVLKDMYNHVYQSKDYFDLYDNIQSLYDSSVDSDLHNIPFPDNPLINPNSFKSNIIYNNRLLNKHKNFIKYNSCTDYIYSHLNYRL